MNIKHIICSLVAIIAGIGALNWLLTAFNFNLVEKITGGFNTFAKIIYVLVGICGIITIGCQLNWISQPSFNK